MPFSRPVYLITCDDTLLLVARPAGVGKHLRAALPRGGRFAGWTTPNRPTQCPPRRAGPRSLFDQPSARAFSAEQAKKGTAVRGALIDAGRIAAPARLCSLARCGPLPRTERRERSRRRCSRGWAMSYARSAGGQLLSIFDQTADRKLERFLRQAARLIEHRLAVTRGREPCAHKGRLNLDDLAAFVKMRWDRRAG